MKTPIWDFVNEYSKSNAVRLHMPGHKGAARIGSEPYDITEIDGADVLYSDGNGIISESENNAKSLFGTKKTLYSAEGSTLSIKAMLYLTVLYAKNKGEKPLILAGRNAHKAFIYGASLLDIDVEWLRGDSLYSFSIHPEELSKKLAEMKSKPTALYITSPDYLGNIIDISAYSKVCKKAGVLLLVDNAHGAYLNFLSPSLHPISLGADVCCDSAHKTLPVLTGGAYLHIGKNSPEFFSDMAESAMKLFASTSPSYLVLASLDIANKYIYNEYKDKLENCLQKLSKLKNSLINNSFTLVGNEPLKLTISSKPYGYEGYEISKILKDNGIIVEASDRDFVTMMFTPDNSDDNFLKIEKIFMSICKKTPILNQPPAVPKLTSKLSLRETLFGISEMVNVKDAVGRVLAEPSVSCPPAIPIAVCGEVIDPGTVALFDYYKIESVRVLKHNI